MLVGGYGKEFDHRTLTAKLSVVGIVHDSRDVCADCSVGLERKVRGAVHSTSDDIGRVWLQTETADVRAIDLERAS